MIYNQDAASNTLTSVSNAELRKGKPQVVSTRGNIPYGGAGGSPRNDTRFESSLNMTLCNSRVGNLQVVYTNTYANVNEESTSLLSSYTLESALVQNGVMCPMTFNGSLQPVLGVGTPLVISDIIGVSLAPMSTIQIRTGAIVAAGNRAPAGCRGGGAATVKVASTSATSQVYSTATMTTPSGGTTTTTTVCPVAVIGIPEKPIPSCLIWGDSIPHGVGDNSDLATGLIGYAERALGLSNIPFVQGGRGGDSTTAYSSPRVFVRAAIMQYVSHVYFTMATNDIFGTTTLAALQTQHRAGWAMAKRAGCKVVVATCPPRTTSTDSWATLANQTPVAGFEVGGIRDQWNAWLLTALANGEIDQLFDINPIIADGNNLKVGLTTDGVHPNNAGHAALYTAFRSVVQGWTV